MKTNGLVLGAAFALAFSAAPLAQVAAATSSDYVVDSIESNDAPESNEIQLTSLLDHCDAVAADCACDECQRSLGCSTAAGRTPFWFAGAEMTILNVNARSGGIITASFSDTTAPGVATQSVLDGNGLNDKFAVAPRIWAGRQFGEKWAVVGRYWELETSDTNSPPASNPAIPTVGTNFATIFEQDKAHFRTADIELMRIFRPGKWKIDGTLGARHAHIGVRSDFLAFGVFTTGNFINLTLQNGFNFQGEGGTSAINVRRQIGNSPFSVFGGFRGSYLGGQTDSFGRSDGTVASSPSAPLVGAATVSRNNADAELDIFEYQVGMQADFPLRRIPVNAFFRCAFEYQNWDIDAPPTGGAGFGGTIGELTTNSFASAGIGHAYLYGVALATGFTY